MRMVQRILAGGNYYFSVFIWGSGHPYKRNAVASNFNPLNVFPAISIFLFSHAHYMLAESKTRITFDKEAVSKMKINA